MRCHGDLLQPRFAAASIYSPRVGLVVLGGVVNKNASTTCEYFNKNWNTLAPINTPRAFHSVCEVNDGLCVAGGGQSGQFSCETFAFGSTYGDMGQWTMVGKATSSLTTGQPTAIAPAAGKSAQPICTHKNTLFVFFISLDIFYIHYSSQW